MPAKLLVVDDEPDLESLVRQKFRRQIRDEEYEFVFARSGAEALSRLSEHPDIGMILSDINMPEMDGLTLLGRINEMKNPLLKAVIVSAYGDMENIRTAMNRGAFDFVTKPIDFNDLETTITKTLKHVEETRRALEDHQKLISMQRDLSVAARIQQSILPRVFPAFPDRKELDIYAEMATAKEVGGDFYDFYFIDQDRLAFVVGDVSGKGVPAAIFMAMCRTLLKGVASQVAHPGECLRRVNAMLVPESDSSMFVTIFYAVLNTRTGEMQYSNGGHNAPYLVRAGGTVDQLEAVGGLFLGAIENLDYDVKKISLQPGDTVFIYTDGVTEAMNAQQELFGEERLLASLQQAGTLPLKDVVRRMTSDIMTFAAGAQQADDITMLALRYLGKG
jgi:sigma-B regulation protein RsbU (phosphoserine phosphatase)